MNATRKSQMFSILSSQHQTFSTLWIIFLLEELSLLECNREVTKVLNIKFSILKVCYFPEGLDLLERKQEVTKIVFLVQMAESNHVYSVSYIRFACVNELHLK